MTPIEQAAQALRNVVAVYDNGTAGYLVDDAINKARAALASLEAAKQEPLTDAARDILAERHRQINAEGWTAEHDDRHGDCELACAAASYALCASETHLDQLQLDGIRVWPWSRAWWKPTTYRRNLVKAGALILAEIERLDRAAAPSPGSGT